MAVDLHEKGTGYARLWRVFADGSIRVIERSWPNNPHGLWIEPFLERKIIQVKEDEQAVIKISVIVIGALVLLVLALYLMKKDQDRPGKRNSVETIGEARRIRPSRQNQKRIWPTPMKRMILPAFSRELRTSAAVSKEPEAEKAAAAASALRP